MAKTTQKVSIYRVTETGHRRVIRRRVKAKIKHPACKIQDQTCPWCGEKFAPNQSIVEYNGLVYHDDCFENWAAAHIYDIVDAKVWMLQPKDIAPGDKIQL